MADSQQLRNWNALDHSHLNSDESHSLDKARAIVGMISDLTANNLAETVEVKTSYMTFATEAILDQLRVMEQGAEQGRKALWEMAPVPLLTLLDLIDEASAPGTLTNERFEELGKQLGWDAPPTRHALFPRFAATWRVLLERRLLLDLAVASTPQPRKAAKPPRRRAHLVEQGAEA